MRNLVMNADSSHVAGAGGRSFLEAGSRVTGELQFPGTVELPGQVKGRVEAASIVIEETGVVEGELEAVRIAIKGRFTGKLTGGTVKLHASARVTGEITCETLSVDSGAELEGQVHAGRSAEPQALLQMSGSDVA
jgi:cytoskeletal protein CcmA (bactofilin family)